MVLGPERDPGLQLLILMLIANGRGELSDRIGRGQFEEMIDDLLRDIENSLGEREFRYFKEIPVGFLLHEVRRALVDSYYYRFGPFRRGEPFEERYEGTLLAKFFEKIDDVDSDVEDFEERLSILEEHSNEKFASIESSILSINDSQRSSNWSLSLGASFSTMRTHRTAPVRVYTKQGLNLKTQRELQTALEAVLDEYGFNIDLDLPAETSSFWKRFWVRTKNIATQKEVEDRFIKLERALETRHIDKPQAEANKLNADSFSAIMKSLEGVDDACVQLGNILLVKYTPLTVVPCKPKVVVRTLSPLEMHAIEQDQTLLKEPRAIIRQLELLTESDASVERREIQRKRALDSDDQGI